MKEVIKSAANKITSEGVGLIDIRGFIKDKIFYTIEITYDHKITAALNRFIDDYSKRHPVSNCGLSLDEFTGKFTTSTYQSNSDVRIILYHKNIPIIIKNIAKFISNDNNAYRYYQLQTINNKNGRRYINNFLKNIINKYNKNDDIYVWPSGVSITQRTTDSVFLEESKRDKIIETVDNFMKSKSWYNRHNIPYHLGILLHGVPGSGKTSTIHMLAQHLGYDIQIASDAEDLYRLLQNKYSTNKHILVLEDVDCDNITRSRKIKPKSRFAEQNICLTVGEDNNERFNLSMLLNCIDGIGTPSGSLIIFTTNNKSDLDPALIRPGRIDLDVEYGYVNHETLSQFCKFHYKKDIPEDFMVKDEITIAMLQNLLLQKYTCNDILNYCRP